MTETPEELLSRMKNGDEEAFTMIYLKYVRAIRNFAGYMGVPADSSEDVSQNVFMALIRNKSSFDADRGSATAFIFGIARNQILRWMRENKTPGTVVLETEVQSNGFDNPLTQYAKGQQVSLLKKAILLLPEHYREVVVLCEIEELNYQQAAEILNCAVGTVRSRLHRARSILIKKLRGMNGEDNGVNSYELPALETGSL